MENPYQDAKDLSPIKWMLKNQGKQMLFSFLFTLIFICFPWIGKFYIENDIVRYSISIAMLGINIISTFLHPYSIWKSSYRSWKRWNDYYNK